MDLLTAWLLLNAHGMIASDERIFRGRSQRFARQRGERSTHSSNVNTFSCRFEKPSVPWLPSSALEQGRRLDHRMAARKGRVEPWSYKQREQKCLFPFHPCIFPGARLQAQ